MNRLTRRRLVLGGGAAGLTLVAGCGLPFAAPPPAARVRRVAYLTGSPPNAATASLMDAFRERLRDLGYVEGRNLAIEERYAGGDDQLAEPTAELVRLQPEVIVVPSPTVALAMRAATTTIPIVSTGTGNLVDRGLAASLAQPGGNVTGLSTPFLGGKQLQLLKEAVPTLGRVTVLYDTSLPDFPPAPYQAAARSPGLELQLQFLGTGGAQDLEPLFEAAVRAHADGLFVSTGPAIGANHTRIAELAVQSRLPSIWQQSEAVGRGGLMGYGPNRPDLYRRAAIFVDHILKGASPADLPVEQPTRFDFAINLKTAQAIGLTIPPSVLAQSTEVIQ